MLAVVKFERFRRHVRRKRVLGVRQVRAAERHDALSWNWQVTHVSTTERRLLAPLSHRKCLRLTASEAVRSPEAPSVGARGTSRWASCFENLNLRAGRRPSAGDRADGGAFTPRSLSAEAILRWLHVFFGITWIGLLYYFNFVQIPMMPTVPAELKPGVSQIYRAQGSVLFPLGRGLHRPDRRLIVA